MNYDKKLIFYLNLASKLNSLKRWKWMKENKLNSSVVTKLLHLVI